MLGRTALKEADATLTASAFGLYHGGRYILTHQDWNGQRMFGDMRGLTAKGVAEQLGSLDWLPDDIERCADTGLVYARRLEWLARDSAVLFIPTHLGVLTQWGTTADVTVEGIAWTRRLLESVPRSTAGCLELRPASDLRPVTGPARTALEWLEPVA